MMTYEDVTPAPPSLIRLFSVFQCLSVAPFYNFLYNKKNSGHGPTSLSGIWFSGAGGQWVFQVDSDNEIRAEHFRKLWSERDLHDAVIGIRDGRQQPLPRRIISTVSRLVVALFYGTGVTDVNCPFRLMRTDVLKQILVRFPKKPSLPMLQFPACLLFHGHG